MTGRRSAGRAAATGRQHPFSEIHLRDEDVKVDLSELNGPQDRLAIVVTEPLTTNETWTRLLPGELVTFVDGGPLTALTAICPVASINRASMRMSFFIERSFQHQCYVGPSN